MMNLVIFRTVGSGLWDLPGNWMHSNFQGCIDIILGFLSKKNLGYAMTSYIRVIFIRDDVYKRFYN